MKAEINRYVELVQVLLFLARQQDKTQQCTNNQTYTSAITKWFTPFEAHPAVAETRKLILTQNFVHIKPIRAILSLEALKSDPNSFLFKWGLAVEQFIIDSHFDEFFKSQNNYYQWILGNCNSCDLNRWIDFIEKYFRHKPDRFKLYICPIAGNYGFNLNKTAYTIRYMPNYHKDGNYDFDYDLFAKGIAHEYAHCFVNPIVEANKNLLENYSSFFKQHENLSSFYNTYYAIINEYFVRAFQLRFMELNKKLFPHFDINKEYLFQKATFKYIDQFINACMLFEESNQSFEDFYLENIGSILRNFKR